MSWRDQHWVTVLSVMLKIGLGVSLVYLGLVYLERTTRKPLQRDDAETIPLHEDLYVHPARTYISSVETARSKLTGTPLWVKEGCRWFFEPGEGMFAPLEKVVPTGVVERGERVLIEFQKDGKKFEFAIGEAGRFWVDDVFFIQDPRQLYDHWSEQDWERIERHEVKLGASEFQAVFALGFGRTMGQSPSGNVRVVDYSACGELGVSPVEITFRQGRAESIEPIAAE